MENRVLFPGTSCFPISPCKKYGDHTDQETTKISENDQLIKILDNIGPLKEQDFSFLSDQTAIEYAEQVSSQRSGLNLQKRFSGTSSEEIELLESMLEFNHQFRCSAKEMLKHKIFDDIRVERLEQGAPYEIHLLCDGMDQYNYSNDRDYFCDNLNDYKQLIISEI